MNPIKTRIVLHFPGFEPLDAAMHRERFARAAKQSAAIWNIKLEADQIYPAEGTDTFSIRASGPNWAVHTQYNVLDLSDHIHKLQSRALLTVLLSGFVAFAKTIAFGGTYRYLVHAWRFGLFSIFPFLLMATGILISALLAFAPFFAGLTPWNLGWSLPFGLVFFKLVVVPLAERFHTLLLFSDWKCAVDFATLQDKDLNERLNQMVDQARAALNKPADEHLILSHSIGANSAVYVIGQLLEQEPKLFAGKKVVFATVGSGLLQGALLAPAKILRARVKTIAENPQIYWFDVQCLTDAAHFYSTKVAMLCGYGGEQQPTVSFIRIKTMLNKERYARIKWNMLRVHRQYVLGNDIKANYDYALMCAGPLSARTFASLPIGQLPPIDTDGSITLA